VFNVEAKLVSKKVVKQISSCHHMVKKKWLATLCFPTG